LITLLAGASYNPVTSVETRSIGYGIAASLAVHILVFVGLGIWMGLSAMHELANRTPEPETEPQVELVYADSFQVAPEPPPPVPEQKPKAPPERYMRTTQNAESEAAPAKGDFISDRNTVASAKLPSTSGGDPTMPTLNGVEEQTMELANRNHKEGEIKQDSALSPKPTPPAPPQATPILQPPGPTPPPPPPVPAAPKPPETPNPEVAKKVDSPAETMMKELDEKLKEDSAKELLPLEVRRPPAKKEEPKPDSPPEMKTPDQVPVMKAEPVAEPLVNTPRPEKDAFQPETRVGKNKGGINTPGREDAVNAIATPKGRYMRKVTSAIEKKWHALSRMRADAVQPGRLRVLFKVSKDGKIKPQDVKILYNKANPMLTDFTITAILEAEIPPIPQDLLPILDDERVEIEYEFVIY